jgi:hypothetical protein
VVELAPIVEDEIPGEERVAGTNLGRGGSNHDAVMEAEMAQGEPPRGKEGVTEVETKSKEGGEEAETDVELIELAEIVREALGQVGDEEMRGKLVRRESLKEQGEGGVPEEKEDTLKEMDIDVPDEEENKLKERDIEPNEQIGCKRGEEGPRTGKRTRDDGVEKLNEEAVGRKGKPEQKEAKQLEKENGERRRRKGKGKDDRAYRGGKSKLRRDAKGNPDLDASSSGESEGSITDLGGETEPPGSEKRQRGDGVKSEEKMKVVVKRKREEDEEIRTEGK